MGASAPFFFGLDQPALTRTQVAFCNLTRTAMVLLRRRGFLKIMLQRNLV